MEFLLLPTPKKLNFSRFFFATTSIHDPWHRIRVVQHRLFQPAGYGRRGSADCIVRGCLVGGHRQPVACHNMWWQKSAPKVWWPWREKQLQYQWRVVACQK
ncbi:hypothetical protein SETIT_6G185500v2 [Setaria italica]|uniref:Uncharacterized protein n=2 Tax=Setaria TaxID=4554 RepID=A0A368RMZ0_SETIT|nr:hypothetical protein SETIT_6G185500v2 [Setaria italica]TKW10806.1 hypothetical protein SEVIR_6G191600v2 [Setaria viridis]TKW10807.1 hypothetical protein SEVIR_6G191600v2 [Setaria viridis]